MIYEVFLCDDYHPLFLYLLQHIMTSLIFIGKLMTVFFHGIAGLVMAECVCTSLIFISFIDVPSLVCVDPCYLSTYDAHKSNVLRVF